jgi:hypothetical protein
MFKIEINRRSVLTAARLELVYSLIVYTSWYWGLRTKQSLKHRYANDGFTTAAMYATATVMDTVSMAGAEGYGGTYCRLTRIGRASFGESPTLTHCAGLAPFLFVS